MKRLPLRASDNVKKRAAFHQITMQPNREGLDSLARFLGAPLPKEPRLLVMQSGEGLLSEAELAGPMPEVPFTPMLQAERDIIVSISEDDAFEEAVLTQGVARALLDRKRELADRNGLRASAGAFLGGLLVAGVGDQILQNNLTMQVGFGIGIAGFACASYYEGRRPLPLPTLQDVDPPITLHSYDPNLPSW